jgi:hypothetical protein
MTAFARMATVATTLVPVVGSGAALLAGVGGASRRT